MSNTERPPKTPRGRAFRWSGVILGTAACVGFGKMTIDQWQDTQRTAREIMTVQDAQGNPGLFGGRDIFNKKIVLDPVLQAKKEKLEDKRGHETLIVVGEGASTIALPVSILIAGIVAGRREDHQAAALHAPLTEVPVGPPNPEQPIIV